MCEIDLPLSSMPWTNFLHNCMVTMSPGAGAGDQLHFLGFLYPSQSSGTVGVMWYCCCCCCFLHGRDQVLILIVLKPRSMLCKFQLYFACVSYIVFVAAFLIAHQDDVHARLEGPSATSSACPQCRVQEGNVLYCGKTQNAGVAKKLAVAAFGRFGSSHVSSRGSIWMLTHARAHQRVFSMFRSEHSRVLMDSSGSLLQAQFGIRCVPQ